MKVAICMSGITRTFKYTYKSYLDNIISKYDCDTFIYVSKDQESDAMNLIPSVRKVVYEKEPKIDIKDYKKYKCKHYSTYGILNQWWKIEECFKMAEQYQKENNIEYKWVIRCRPDLLILREIDDLNKLDNNFMYVFSYPPGWYDDEKLFAPNFSYSYPTINGVTWGVPDQFAVSNMQNMRVYSYRFSNFDDYYNRTGILSPEGTLSGILKDGKVPLKFCRPLYKILRTPEALLMEK